MITYLIGAGTSYYAIPLVKNLNKRLVTLVEEIHKTPIPSNAFKEYPFIKNYNIQTAKDELLEDAKWLEKEAGDNSIDTLAKRYSDLNDQRKLNKIKATLTAYLIFEQTKNEIQNLNEGTRRIDYRYLDFLAKTSRPKDKLVKINNQINVISWNYDMQWELAYFKYYPELLISQIHDLLNYYPRINNKEENIDNLREQFTLIKLNGTAGLFEYEQNSTILAMVKNLNELDNFEAAQEALKAYLHSKGQLAGYQSGLRFAFERKNYLFDSIEISKKAISESNKIIVIGYSFPEFNREYDREILLSLKANKEIIIQDTPESSLRIAEIISSIYSDQIPPKITIKNNLEYFYIPPLQY
ncbi:hypothetical protein CH381_23630 [Leptospira sp. mixed culture ATI2-C-A1]|nr:hypothetical protein CH381_23630 [Leptospira sp. mixed culture ATI2-C-A1]